jgi:hypothetical protein
MPSVEYHHSLPLSTNEFLAERRLSLASALRKLAFAKERVAIERLAELEIFHEALRSEAEETHSLPYRAQQAVALASAARDTVEAEKEVAKCEMVVVILLLAAKEGKMEEAGGRLNEAEKQYCTLVQSVLTKTWALIRPMESMFTASNLKPDILIAGPIQVLGRTSPAGVTSNPSIQDHRPLTPTINF